MKASATLSPLAAWPDALADSFAALALELEPQLAPNLLDTLRRCVARLELERQAGHVCLPLSAPEAARLRACGLVEDDPAQPQGRPLVIDAESRLYLQRDHEHERALARHIARQLDQPMQALPEAALARLRELFPPQHAEEPDWQAVAVAQALRRPLTAISGGPGTGKTSTVVKLLACVLAAEPGARIALAAPTGKAAQRMLEALREGAERLGLQGLPLPQQALTLHRLLGAGPRGFRHGPQAPLLLDWLVVDEASMLDLQLARQLFDALGPGTRLVLLGDRHQLAAVENGAVFAELSRAPAWSAELAAQLAQDLQRPLRLPPSEHALRDLAVAFTRSHRFKADSGIGRFAAAVREGQAEALAPLLAAGLPDLHWLPCHEAAPPTQPLEAQLQAGFAAYREALLRLWQGTGSEAEVWRAWAAFRVLCAGHHGPWGTRALNERCAQQLQGALPPGAPPQLGLPLLVTRNQGPWVNGDVLLLLPSTGGGLEAAVQRGESLQRVPLEQLPAALDGAFAMTVHKAQGSEFDAVLLLLPPTPAQGGGPSREWLYTGATRARQRLSLIGSDTALHQVLANPDERRSGLMRMLARI